MTIEDAKQYLTDQGFAVVDSTLQTGDIVKEPLIAVKVSLLHRCNHDWCQNGVHPLATETAIKHMERVAFEAIVREDLESNR